MPLLHAVVLLLHAFRVRLIDFTASRLQTPGCDVVFCDLEGEDGLFDGPKGKPQFETYRYARLVPFPIFDLRRVCTTSLDDPWVG